jgi:hypothetical protein
VWEASQKGRRLFGSLGSIENLGWVVVKENLWIEWPESGETNTQCLSNTRRQPICERGRAFCSNKNAPAPAHQNSALPTPVATKKQKPWSWPKTKLPIESNDSLFER